MKYLAERVSRQGLFERRLGPPVQVVFILQLQTFWNSFASVAQEMNRRERFRPLVVLASHLHAGSEQAVEHIEHDARTLEALGLKYVTGAAFNIHRARPDLLFFSSPYTATRKASYLPALLLPQHTRSAVIPYCMEAMGDVDFLKMYFGCCREPFWRYFTSSEICARAYRHILGFPDWMCPVVGNPEYDVIFNTDERSLPKFQAIKKMAAGRKIVLWTPHYTNDKWGTWDRLAVPMLKLFRSRAAELFVVLRPHQLMSAHFYQAQRDGAPGPDCPDSLRQAFTLMREAGNFWIDGDGAAIESVYATDGLVSDLSSMLAKGMALKKSLLFLKNRGHEDAGPATRIMNAHMHTGYELEAVADFVDMLLGGTDPLLPVPQAALRLFCGPVDGKAGQRIVDLLEHYFFRLRPEDLPPLPEAQS